MRCHEIDGGGRCHLCRDHQVAFVLAIFVIDQHEHAPVARFLDDFLHRCQHGAVIIRSQKRIQLRQRFRRRVPVFLGTIAQRIGMKSGSTRDGGT